MAGQLLHIKPILTLSEGEVLPLKKVRGAQKAYREFERAFVEGTQDSPTLRVGIAHAEAPERLQALETLVRTYAPTSGDRGRNDPRPRRGHARRAGHDRLLLVRRPLADQLGGSPRQLDVAVGDRVLHMRPPAERHAVPVDRDVGVVVSGLGERADPVHERERLREVAEEELALQRAVDLGPALGCFHRA